MTSSLPSSLHVATPAEGLRLARQLAEHTAGQTAPASMSAHLSTGSAAPSLEQLTALHFQTISLVNQGWSSKS